MKTLMMLMALMATITGANAQLPGLANLPVIKELPDPFRMSTGEQVTTQADWARRRAEIKAMLLHYEYGQMPPAPDNLQAQEIAATPVFDGAATERQVLLTCGPEGKVRFHLFLTVPNGKPGPFPVLLDGDRCWGAIKPEIVQEVVRRGYMLAEFDRTELDGDNADRSDGVHPLYPDYDWGTLAAWAWGFHRAVDYLLTREDVEMRHIAVTGHSRGGKTALLAGALDERVALVAPNDSGCGGAGAFRHQGEKSEDIAAITKQFPYWFHPRLREFVGRVDQLPFDQHLLLALVAPRPLLIRNALDDLWANLRGTEQTYLAAKEVFQFLGAGDRIGNTYRPGGHAHNLQDWRTLLDFADKQFFGKTVESKFDGIQFPGTPQAFSWKAPAPR